MRPNPASPAAPAAQTTPPAIRTLGELRRSGYRPRSVKAELRANAMASLAAGVPLLRGLRGYEDTVEPELAHALLSGHDLLLLGLRGQGKTRLLRGLVDLLDEWIPVIDDAAVELREDPLAPITRFGREAVARRGADLTIRWVHRSDRYVEKLATPDVTIADLIGEIDIVKHAEGRYLGDEATMHFGLVPRANRGLLIINELPDLSPRIQVGLFNVLEERDVQVRGYTIRLPLDLALHFSANPEDYTNRGRIVTPLKDRIGSVIRTHYPRGNRLAMQITRENAFLDRAAPDRSAHADHAPPAPHAVTKPVAAPKVVVPDVMHEILEEMINRARRSSHINQASGVSVRASITALENAVSSAEARALRQGEPHTCVRPGDLYAAIPGCRGKVELLLSEDGTNPDGRATEDRLLEALLGEAIKVIVGRLLPIGKAEPVSEAFTGGLKLALDSTTPAAEALASMKLIDGLLAAAGELAKAAGLDTKDEQQKAAAGELVLEYLYVNQRLSKNAHGFAR